MFRFYVGCDFCQDWFHGTCVGITSVEAAGIDEYRCPNCCKKSDRDFVELKPLSQKEIDGLKRLLRSLTVNIFINFLLLVAVKSKIKKELKIYFSVETKMTFNSCFK